MICIGACTMGLQQAENMLQAFSLAYGLAHLAPLTALLRYFRDLQQDDHRFPFTFIADAWEEVFWRATEEARHSVATLLKSMGKEGVRKEDFVSAALTVRADGTGPALVARIVPRHSGSSISGASEMASSQ